MAVQLVAGYAVIRIFEVHQSQSACPPEARSSKAGVERAPSAGLRSSGLQALSLTTPSPGVLARTLRSSALDIDPAMPSLAAILTFTSLSLLASPSPLPLLRRDAALRDSPSGQYAPSVGVCPANLAVRRPSTEVSFLPTFAAFKQLISRTGSVERGRSGVHPSKDCLVGDGVELLPHHPRTCGPQCRDFCSCQGERGSWSHGPQDWLRDQRRRVKVRPCALRTSLLLMLLPGRCLLEEE